MNKRSVFFSAAFLCASMALLAFYIYRVVAAAGSPTDVAGLILAATAVGIGLYSAVVASLSYRLQLGKIPAPEVFLLVDGRRRRDWNLSMDLAAPELDIEHEVEAQAAWLESRIPSRTVRLLTGGVFGSVHEDDVRRYREGCARYCDEYADFLVARNLVRTFEARTRTLELVVVNDKATVAVEGAVLILHFSLELDIFSPFEALTCPEAPAPPDPPKVRSYLDPVGLPRLTAVLPDLALALGSPAGEHQWDEPFIERAVDGGTRVIYEMSEIRHKLGADTRHAPLLVGFSAPGRYRITYELHARNLPNPVSGSLGLSVQHTETAAISAEILQKVRAELGSFQAG